MADWNPALYARFSDERDRPIADLLARVDFDAPEKVVVFDAPERTVDLAAPKRIVDLGCGAGASTAPLVARWPAADVLGIDTSPAMLDKARERVPSARFEEADAATWAPEEPVDLIFSNAALQWLPDHETLLPRLMGHLAPGGVLAVQMPDNLDEPSHARMRDVARRPAFAAALADVVDSRKRISSIEKTYELLAPRAARVDVWRTTYVHPLAGPEAIVEMISSTGLRPFLDALDETTRPAFVAAYAVEIAAAYPRVADGRVLFRFPRLFFVAVRAA